MSEAVTSPPMRWYVTRAAVPGFPPPQMGTTAAHFSGILAASSHDPNPPMERPVR